MWVNSPCATTWNPTEATDTYHQDTMRLPLILASALLITLVAGGVLYTWYSTGPVEVTISNQGSSNLAIELVQVSEGYAPD